MGEEGGSGAVRPRRGGGKPPDVIRTGGHAGAASSQHICLWLACSPQQPWAGRRRHPPQAAGTAAPARQHPPKLRPTMQCQVGPNLESASFLMKAATSFSIVKRSIPWTRERGVPVSAR